jgi:hypothetical protein
MFTDQQGGLKLKIAALKVTKKTATKDAEVRKVSPVVTKLYGKEKPKVEKTSTQVQAVVRPDAKTNSSKKLEVRKKPLEVRDGSRARGVGRTQNRDKVPYMHLLLMIGGQWVVLTFIGHVSNLFVSALYGLAGQALHFFNANAFILPIKIWLPDLYKQEV